MVVVITAVILAIVAAIGIIVTLTVRKRKKEGKLQETSYRTFYVMGIILVPLGLVSMLVYFVLQIPFFIMFPLFAVGLVYLIIGLTHRDKWQKNS
jgi:magnesium-transporting ATPase (P-type)